MICHFVFLPHFFRILDIEDIGRSHFIGESTRNNFISSDNMKLLDHVSNPGDFFYRKSLRKGQVRSL